MGNRTNTEMNKKIGKMLQKARMSKRLTQGEVAKHIGISEHHLSAIERGVSKASVEVLLGYCETLSVSPNDILDF